jgi:SAM-dependent methyltransferase
MTVFGEVAADYERIRPGYPMSIASAIADVVGTEPGAIVEVGAGTGKGTEVFLRLGGALTCLEPDPRMATELTRRFPQVTVDISDLESWDPPPGGVDVLCGAMVWHHVGGDRVALAHAALRPGGTLALVGRVYAFADEAQDEAFSQAFTTAWPDPGLASRAPDWINAEIASSDLFGDVQTSRHDSALSLAADDYLLLVTTFSPYRALPAPRRQPLLDRLRAAIDATGGVVDVDLRTSLTIARRLG